MPLKSRGRRLVLDRDVLYHFRATAKLRHVELAFENYFVSEHQAWVHNLWLRDACPCNECVSESSGQKRFATYDVDASPQLESCRVTEGGDLEVVWANDFLTGGSHTSIYPLDFLQRVLMTNGRLHFPYRPHLKRTLWDKSTFTKDFDSRFISYEDWMAGGDVFVRALLNIQEWGLIFIRGVPESHDAVQDIANKIGSLQSTLYGLTWDVISKPNAENVAYTNESLCLHQDLLYWEDMPKLQLLHCLKNECEGGESLFSDGLRAATEIKTSHRDHYDLLTSVPVSYHYTKNGFYSQQRSVITEAGLLPVKIFWSPPFQAPFHHPFRRKGAGKLQHWHGAARQFRDSIESPENMFQHRLQPGDCVIFDNQRILHGRTRFDTSIGFRHLRGGYVDSQTLESVFVRLGEQAMLGLLEEDATGSRYKSGIAEDTLSP
ncbi:Gamma-butyrobetaine dioxygenase [Cytospora mali]|uniref:Gamma-butyrobetaine dioxygenase n=1 Tax=Cytospora mali TaxID=578113 RepID=A0A194W2B3_CYTMA|nr:Gamma-butyrobetaine dioxygenase [Valsa mali]